ncbi:MAG: hypothetical protein ABSA02_41795 [Trebonia sp.]|jgi:hypothetical protein
MIHVGIRGPVYGSADLDDDNDVEVIVIGAGAGALMRSGRDR